MNWTCDGVITQTTWSDVSRVWQFGDGVDCKGPEDQTARIIPPGRVHSPRLDVGVAARSRRAAGCHVPAPDRRGTAKLLGNEKMFAIGAIGNAAV